jgi:hypothetical protein
MPPPKKRRDEDEEDEPKPRKRRRPDPDEDEDEDEDGDSGGVVSSIIPYRNWQALTAYYCGFAGLLPGVGLLLCPAAMIFGFLGLLKARSTPGAKGTGHAIVGMLLAPLGLLLQVVYGFLFYVQLYL